MKLKYMFFLLVLISCKVPANVSVEKVQEKCKSHIHAMLESRAALLIETEGGAFDFDHEKVDTPEDWQTKKWNFELGELFALEAIGSKYLEYRQSLLDLDNEIKNAQCVVTIEDFNNHFKKPSSKGKTDEIIYYYFMNSKTYPDCYRADVREHQRFDLCRFFAVFFDSNGNFKRISTVTFAYQ